jgi:hypothetical protein
MHQVFFGKEKKSQLLSGIENTLVVDRMFA